MRVSVCCGRAVCGLRGARAQPHASRKLSSAPPHTSPQPPAAAQLCTGIEHGMAHTLGMRWKALTRATPTRCPRAPITMFSPHARALHPPLTTHSSCPSSVTLVYVDYRDYVLFPARRAPPLSRAATSARLLAHTNCGAAAPHALRPSGPCRVFYPSLSTPACARGGGCWRRRVASPGPGGCGRRETHGPALLRHVRLQHAPAGWA